MLKAIFGNGKTVEVVLASSTEHEVTLLGKTGANTSGFVLRRIEDDFLLGDYTDFTTIYEKVDGGYTFSNDGSVAPIEEELEEIEEEVEEE